jgi:hypothetical protein
MDTLIQLSIPKYEILYAQHDRDDDNSIGIKRSRLGADLLLLSLSVQRRTLDQQDRTVNVLCIRGEKLRNPVKWDTGNMVLLLFLDVKTVMSDIPICCRWTD